MSSIVLARGTRRVLVAYPRSQRNRSSRSAASPASSTPKPPTSPSAPACRRTKRWASEWKVPPTIVPAPAPADGAWARARPTSSWAARRVKVTSSSRSGGCPWEISHAALPQSVVVLPVPAPARISSVPPSWVAASSWRSFSDSSSLLVGSAWAVTLAVTAGRG